MINEELFIHARQSDVRPATIDDLTGYGVICSKPDR
jgi:hypothetical protein